MDSYITVKEYGKFEYEDRKSVFIGEAQPVKSENEALAFIEGVRKKFPDAKHHVFAYVIRENSIMRFSDDKEPQGTAGMPVLDIIRKNGCTDVAIVVTRYFGGTLLGTGGLVRAYTSAAAGALKNANIVVFDVYSELVIEVNYSDYQKISGVLSESGFRESSVHYSDKVEIEGTIISKNKDEFIDKLTQITAGRSAVTVIDERFDC